MASAKQKAAARKNIKKAQAALRAKKAHEGKAHKAHKPKKTKKRAAKKAAHHHAPKHHAPKHEHHASGLPAGSKEFLHGMYEGARDVQHKKPLRKVTGKKDEYARGYREGVRSARAAKKHHHKARR
jgi:hypothetical protein